MSINNAVDTIMPTEPDKNRHQLVTSVDASHAHEVRLDDTFEFLNTDDIENGSPVERLPTLDAALDWFVDRGVIHREGADRLRVQADTDAVFARADLARVHAVRSALREVADALVDHRQPSLGALDTVNRALHARQVIELVPSTDGCVAVDHRHVGDPIDDALARLSDPFVTELVSGHPERIRVCDNDRCGWYFYDTSRTGKRRWCDMATCGNQAKAARHRAKVKKGEAEILGEVPAIAFD
jgi:predicted RNA-binding Zn ribbon-like protein